MIYEGGYVWPPRPEKAVSHHMLPAYEMMGWRAEVKMNGQCATLVRMPSGRWVGYDRHDKPLAWAPPEETVSWLDSKLPAGSAAISCELMHAKVPGIRDTIYIHDALALGGELLVGSRHGERTKMLREMLGAAVETNDGLCAVSPRIWVAVGRTKGFAAWFASMVRPEHEGVVLKDPNGRMEMPFRGNANVSWSCKVRRPHKNYGF